MKKNLIFIVVLFIGLVIGFQVNAKEKAEEGFNGIAWGTDIATLSDMEYISPSIIYGYKYDGIDFYSRKKDKSKMYGTKVSYIRYGFFKGKLYIVVINFDKTTGFFYNEKRISEAISREFGDFEGRDGRYWHWRGKGTDTETKFETYFLNSEGVEINSPLLYISSKSLMGEYRNEIKGEEAKLEQQRMLLEKEQHERNKEEKPTRDKELFNTIWETIKLTIIYDQKMYEYNYETTSDKIASKAEETKKWTLEKYDPCLRKLDAKYATYIRNYGGDAFRDFLIKNDLLKWWTKQETAEEAYNRIGVKNR